MVRVRVGFSGLISRKRGFDPLSLCRGCLKLIGESLLLPGAVLCYLPRGFSCVSEAVECGVVPVLPQIKFGLQSLSQKYSVFIFQINN